VSVVVVFWIGSLSDIFSVVLVGHLNMHGFVIRALRVRFRVELDILSIGLGKLFHVGSNLIIVLSHLDVFWWVFVLLVESYVGKTIWSEVSLVLDHVHCFVYGVNFLDTTISHLQERVVLHSIVTSDCLF
jgi:hypothetical protein